MKSIGNKYKLGFKGIFITLVDLKNSYVIIPKGTMVKAERIRGGFSIITNAPCPTCKCEMVMDGIKESDLKLMLVSPVEV